ncbi:3-deoxy-D-manno-octulosonic acid transferase [Chthonobacter rhizosphaerae]|uniref:3-deoxy-D-manno-octulosonic acid transferase n=1 Tax=Chthonobacter rhizosphaerae TaxID=2735553 RepID=UPI0015EE83D6|nr:3-deoxy-D-manno-octulosonic acid transferase [Chthonobacter rhizosphaerae]
MRDVGDHLLGAYARLTGLARPVGRAVVAARRRAGKEDATRWRERLGVPGAPRPPGPVVWVHAASVGETVAVLPLVRRVAEADVAVLLTTITTTSADMARRQLPASVVHQYMPLDMAPYVESFLDAWTPRLAIFVESEIWPVAVRALARRDIPLVVSNGRMSARSFRGWRRFPAAASAVFGRIPLCLAQSEADAARFETLGVRRAVSVGNIKFDAPVPEAGRTAAAALRQAVGDRPVLLAASTHEGEDEVILEAFERLKDRLPDLLLILAPRHPERGGAVAAMAGARGLSACQRGTGALPARGTDVYVADTVGELGTLYRLATVAFVGGSLVPHGGHNPIEPARLGAAIVSGPHVANFEDIFAAMLKEGAAALADGPDSLAAIVEDLVRHDGPREAQVDAATAVVQRYAGALERTWTALEPMLAPLAAEARAARSEAGA